MKKQIILKKYLEIGRALLLLGAFIVIPVSIGNWRPDLLYWNAGLWKDLYIWGGSFALVTLGLAFFRTHRAALLVGLTLLYLGIGVGVAQATAVVAFISAMYALGRLLLYAAYREQRRQPLLVESLLIGAGAYSALFALLIHYPVNYPLVYAALLAAPLVAGLRLLDALPGPNLQARLEQVGHDLSHRLRRIGYWKLAGALCVIAYMARYAFYPTLSYDDNALHLRIWTTLAHNHVYDFDTRSQVWAVAPFVVDLLVAIPSLLAGANARGAFNLALLALLLYSMWQLARLILRSRAQRLLLLVLFVTTPLTALLMAGQQTELMLSVMATSGVLLALRRSSSLTRPATAALIMMAALCCGIKVTGALMGMAVLAVWICRFPWRQRGAASAKSPLPWPGLLLVVALGSVVAFQSYAYAWYTTGNPVLPLYNGIFKSPAFSPVNFIDPTYSKGASLRAYWELFFQTDLHQESANYVGGFQYLLLLPLALLMLLGVRHRARASLMLVPLLGFGVVMFFTLQYLRYLYPVMPLAAVLIGAVLSERSALPGTPVARMAAGTSLLLFCGANLFFVPGVLWFFSTPLRTLYTEAGRVKLVKQLVPEQFLNQQLNATAPGAVVLYEPARPYGATLAALPAYLNWYAQWRELESMQLKNAAELSAFLVRNNISYVYWEYTQVPDDRSPFYGYRNLLRDYLSQFGVPEMQVGNIVMYRLQPKPLVYRPAVDISDFSLLDPTRSDVSAPGIAAGEAPRMVHEFEVDGARAIRYAVQLDCSSERGNFVAQINWDKGAPYYHVVPCFHKGEKFVEAFPIPPGATKGLMYITRQAGGPVVVRRLQVELY